MDGIESSGKILGVAIGTSMAEAREKLDPLRVPADYEPDAKEESGRRIYWKLKETEYDWLMAWGNAAGKITRIRAVLRPGRARPFSEIGNLTSAASADATQARWNLRAPDGANYRLIAQGVEQRANTVYMFSLQFPGEEHEASEPETED